MPGPLYSPLLMYLDKQTPVLSDIIFIVSVEFVCSLCKHWEGGVKPILSAWAYHILMGGAEKL